MGRKGARKGEAAVLVNVTPPEGHKYWLEESMLPQDRLGGVKPTFKIGEVAKVFFARSPDWLRWLGSRKDADPDSMVLDVRRTDAGSRIYTLVDVERIAHTLLEHEKINAWQFTYAISTVCAMALQYGILKEADLVPSNTVPGHQQQVIPLVDEEIEAALRRSSGCEACQKEQHQDCETAAEVAALTWKGDTVMHIDDPCPCFTADPDKHE